MKENKILISILVPTYNRVKYLEECLDSIVEQEWFDLKELELIVSDNSEWNETKSFMNNYIKKHKDWNIKYNKNKKNLWMVWNWNKLLELKKWEYFIFLSDDDKFYDENSLNKLYVVTKKYNCDVCRWLRKEFSENGIILNEIDPDSWKLKNKSIYEYSFYEELLHHTISFWWNLYRNIDYLYEDGAKFAADWNFNLQYLYNDKKVIIFNDYTFLYRLHNSQLSRDRSAMGIKIWFQTAMFNYKFFKLPLYLRLYHIIWTCLDAIIFRVKHTFVTFINFIYDGK